MANKEEQINNKNLSRGEADKLLNDVQTIRDLRAITDHTYNSNVWGKLTVYANVEKLWKHSYFSMFYVTMTNRKPCTFRKECVSLQKLNRGNTLKPVCHNVEWKLKRDGSESRKKKQDIDTAW